MSDDSSLKQFSYVGLGRLISNGLQGIFFIVIATFLDPIKYGELSYLISIAGTASIVSTFGFPFLSVIYQAKGDTNLANTVNVFSVLSVTVASLILLFVNVYVALFCFALSLFVMNQHNLLGLKKYKKYFRNLILRGILFITLPIVLYFVYDIQGILIGMIISYFITSIGFIKLISKIKKFPKFNVNPNLLVQNFSVDAAFNLPRWIDKLVIVPLLGFAIVGIYQFNLQILFFVAVLPAALHSFLLSEESSGKKQKKITLLTIFISISVVLVIILVSPYVIESVFPKFVEGTLSLQIMITSIIPLTFASILVAKLQAKESTKIGYSAIVRISSLLILTVILGNFMGLTGLAFAVLISTILFLVAVYVIFKKS